MARNQKYRLIYSNESETFEEKEDSAITYKISRTTQSLLVVISCLVFAGIITLVSTITLLVQEKPTMIYNLPQLDQPLYTDCGGNAEEARRRNCTFDWMMSAWYTPECHHADLLQEAHEKKEWEWYLMPDGTYKVPTSVIAKGEHEVAWTTEWFHREHCSYMWKKQLRYVNDWMWMDSEVHDYNHTAHCAGFVLQPTILKAKNDTFLIPMYPTCLSLRKKWDWVDPNPKKSET